MKTCFKAIVLGGLLSQLAFAQSMVVNDGFEADYGGWTNSGDGIPNLTAVRGEGYNSARAMKVSGRAAPENGAASLKGFYFENEGTYDYSVYVKHAGKSAETFKLTLTWQLPSGAFGSEVIATGTVPPNQWTKLAASYAAPSGSSQQTFLLTTNSVTDFYFDDFVVINRGVENAAGPATPVALAMPPASVGLKDIYAKHFRVGNILNSGTVNNTDIQNIMKLDYNSISSENEHKPDATLTRTGSTSTDIKAQIGTGTAAIMKFCSDNKIPLRGHVLTWHGQTPNWFFIENINDPNANSYRGMDVNQVPWATVAVMNQRLESYIKNLFAMYAAQYPRLHIYAYDVTNEAFDGNGKMRPRGFSPWQGVYGDDNIDWIRNAFTYARKYAPAHTKLFYNDFNEWQSGKKKGIIDRVLKPFFAAGILDGMGMQSHVSANPNDGWNGESQHLPAMEEYAAIGKGFEVQLTELDPSTDSSRYASQQPGRYANIFKKALEINKKDVGKITAICIWTPSDNNTWLGSENTPALHDRNYQRKPAYEAIANLVPESEWGDGDNPEFSFGGGAANIGCNLNNLQPSYTGGCNNIPRPNVTCSNGAAGTASFSVDGSAVTEWNNASGTKQFCNSGIRNVTLTSLVCGSTTVTPSSPVNCGSFIVRGEPVECNYQTSYCGGKPFADVEEASNAVPATGTCVYIGDFEKIQPELEATVAINGVENTCADEWGEVEGKCPFNTKPPAIDGGYYVYVKTGGINLYEDNPPIHNGWQGVVAAIKPNCGTFTTGIKDKIPSDKTLHLKFGSAKVVEIYNLKGKKVASYNVLSAEDKINVSLPSGVYIAKARGMQSVKFVVR